MSAPSDRYEGKPFLRLLDCYVLRAIGYLDDAQESGLQAMEPKFREVYNTDGSWVEIVAKQMEFPDHLPAEIKRIWDEGSLRAENMGFTPDPGDFTTQFVDTNFV
jgi:hypothetical protein